MKKKSRERLVFESLLQDGEKSIAADRLAGALQRAGLRMDDPRLVDSLRR